MRKYVIGFVVGLIMSIGITAYAEEFNSMIGKVVQGTFPVYINGDKFDNEAIVIDGTSYLPVREVAERLGLDVEFDLDKGVNLLNKLAQESEPDIDNTPEFMGLIVTSPTSGVNYYWFNDPISEIDPDIRTIKYGDVTLYSVGDYINKFGAETPGGKAIFSESNGNYIILKTDGTIVTYTDINKKQVQIIDGELYLNVKSYPQLPGYPIDKPLTPTPISGSTESKSESEANGKLQLSPTLQQNTDEIQKQLEQIIIEIERKESLIRQAERLLEMDLTEEDRNRATAAYQNELSELEELKHKKTELEKQLQQAP